MPVRSQLPVRSQFQNRFRTQPDLNEFCECEMASKFGFLCASLSVYHFLCITFWDSLSLPNSCSICAFTPPLQDTASAGTSDKMSLTHELRRAEPHAKVRCEGSHNYNWWMRCGSGGPRGVLKLMHIERRSVQEGNHHFRNTTALFASGSSSTATINLIVCGLIALENCYLWTESARKLLPGNRLDRTADNQE